MFDISGHKTYYTKGSSISVYHSYWTSYIYSNVVLSLI